MTFIWWVLLQVDGESRIHGVFDGENMDILDWLWEILVGSVKRLDLESRTEVWNDMERFYLGNKYFGEKVRKFFKG